MILEIMDERKQGERARDYAYRVLRHNIITLRQPPATVLNEAEISEQLEMSRTPIREALILLREERLVDIIPQRGSAVSLISLHLASEGYFMRLALEIRMLHELGGRLTAEQGRMLHQNIQAQQEALERRQGNVSAEFFALDDEMHHMLYQFCGRERVYESVSKMCTHYNRIRYLNTSVMGEAEQGQLLEQHRTIYYYLTLGLPVGNEADQFYEQHLGRWLKAARKVVEKFPEYFEE